MSNAKRILILAGFIIFVIIMGFLLYIVFFQPMLPSGNTNGNTNGLGGLPAAGTNTNIAVLPGRGGVLPGGNANVNANINRPVPPPVQPSASDVASGGVTNVTTLSETPVMQPTISPDGKGLYYYNQADGKFYTMSPDGKAKPLSDKTFYNVQDVTWSNNSGKAVLEYPDGANIVYDFTTNKQVTLPAHWQDFNFSPNDNQLISKSFGLDKENSWLVVSDTDGTRSKILTAIDPTANDIITDWSPNNQMVAMQVGDLDYNRKEIYFIGLNDENFKSTIVEGWGFQSQWTPEGDRLLYSVYSQSTNDKPELWLTDATPNTVGANRRDLKIQTWADKCTFASNATAYCAVPTQLQEGAGLFPDEMDNSYDVVYKINLNTGSKSLIAQPTYNITMKNLLVSDDNQYLYFTDKNDGKLYKIRLK